MELAFIVIGIIALGTFLEARHLSKNNIRHDENIFYIICGVCMLLLLILAIADGEDLKNLLK